MITQEQQKQGAELMRTLVEKAWESAAFKDQLVKNPVATIESITGSKVNQEINFVVEDQTNDSIIYFNIPRKLDFENMELTDEQLEDISGGESVILAACAVLTVIGASFYAGYSMGKDRATTQQ